MLTGVLWPVHPKPYPDELQSSWIVRLARCHGLKVQVFGKEVFKGQLTLWSRDIDRLAPDWLLHELSARTATPLDRVKETTLRSYVGVLYPNIHESWIQRWILPLKVYHSMRRGFPLQYCPHCLAAEPEPYFRKQWRLALLTYCPEHQVMLLDRCPSCGAPVAFHRRELGKNKGRDEAALSQCYQCDFDLRNAQTEPVSFYEESLRQELEAAVGTVLGLGATAGPRDVGYFAVCGHTVFLMTHRYRSLKLQAYVCEQLGVSALPIPVKRTLFENLDVAERHHNIQLVMWLMADFEQRITAAWYGRAVTYSALLKDFREEIPDWYARVVAGFTHWRLKILPEQPVDRFGRFLPRH